VTGQRHLRERTVTLLERLQSAAALLRDKIIGRLGAEPVR